MEELDKIIEKKILELCSNSVNGITDKCLQKELPDIDSKVRAKTINALLSANKIDLFKQGSELVFKIKKCNDIEKIKESDNEEKVVYRIIEETGNMGIWIRDIRLKSNLMLTQVNKVLKSLESKKLIKAIKSVSASKKKVYMLYNIQPDCSVTGGAWYSDQDFESEFVEILNQQCYKFLQQKLEISMKKNNNFLLIKSQACATSQEVWDYISKLGISKVELSVQDIECILDSLIYDGKIEKNTKIGFSDNMTTKTNIYFIVEKPLDYPSLVCVPCGLCPLINKCSDIGHITQEKCVYMKEWLETI